MICEGIDSKWVRLFNDELTFCGALEECYDVCAKRWNEDTRSQYSREYSDRILPNLRNHNEKPIRNYTKQDYEETIIAISDEGTERGGAYADTTIQHFRHLIDVVVQAAADRGLCDNVLWGSRFSLSEDYTAEDGVQEYVKLKKSLTISEEIAVADALLTNSYQRGQHMGLLMMYAMGLRNNESCGANFGDIRPMRLQPGRKVLWIYKSTMAGSNDLKSSGKTRNADRIIPIPDRVAQFLEERRKFIEERITFSEDDEVQSVDELPIACVEENFKERCSSSQLTAACRELFRRIHFSARQLAYIEASLDEDPDADIIKEKDPTAYLLRRNFGTHLYVLGLTEAEIEYVIGHDIADEYETRNEFINEEKLLLIAEKMARRPIVNTMQAIIEPHRLHMRPSRVYRISNQHASEYNVQTEGHVVLRLSAKEPVDTLRVGIRIQNGSKIIVAKAMTHLAQKDCPRSIDILEHYHSTYKKYSST